MDWFLYDNGRRHERVKEKIALLICLVLVGYRDLFASTWVFNRVIISITCGDQIQQDDCIKFLFSKQLCRIDRHTSCL